MKFEVRGIKVELPTAKIVLYTILLSAAIGFGVRFFHGYNRFMDDRAGAADTDISDPKLTTTAQSTVGTTEFYDLLVAGSVFFISTLWFGLMFAHDASHFLGGRAMKVLDDDEGEGMPDPEYDQAEDTWANGNYLEAVQMLRDFHTKNPTAVHAQLRIAEIYEKDLHNPLAAALEYEEVLKQRLPAERWGWTAIHLCNVYYHLNQPDKAVALLRRIIAEYGKTSAAAKARKRLEEEGLDPGDALPEEEPGPKLPPGFGPRRPDK